MSKWARVILDQVSPVQEIITYDPIGTINEKLLYMFKPCPDETDLTYYYNPETDTFFVP